MLADIDDYLQRWGHYRLAVDMHERLNGRLTRPYWQMATANALGTSYATLGQTGRAIEHYQQALAIAREAGDRGIEGLWLGGLGGCYADLGQTGRAVEHYQQALAIAREIGHRSSEGLWLGGLGGCYADLGQTGRAIEHYQQALAIAREIGHRSIEGTALGNLGSRYATLGQTGRAIEHYQQALAIAREIGDRGSEGCWLGGLGGCHADLGQTGQAIDYYQQAAGIGDDIGDAQVQAEACLGLAYARLYRGEWPEARRAAEAARSYGYGPVLPQVFAALGTAHLREGDRADAGEAFSAALSAANTLLAGTHGMISVLYARGIASAGQAITGERDAARAARRTFEQALTVAPLPGVRVRTLRQFDLLAAADPGGVLTDIRLTLAEQRRGNA